MRISETSLKNALALTKRFCIFAICCSRSVFIVGGCLVGGWNPPELTLLFGAEYHSKFLGEGFAFGGAGGAVCDVGDHTRPLRDFVALLSEVVAELAEADVLLAVRDSCKVESGLLLVAPVEADFVFVPRLAPRLGLAAVDFSQLFGGLVAEGVFAGLESCVDAVVAGLLSATFLLFVGFVGDGYLRRCRCLSLHLAHKLFRLFQAEAALDALHRGEGDAEFCAYHFVFGVFEVGDEPRCLLWREGYFCGI